MDLDFFITCVIFQKYASAISENVKLCWQTFRQYFKKYTSFLILPEMKLSWISLFFEVLKY